MASFKYLWSHRVHFSILDIRFYRAWAKRLLLCKQLIKSNIRRARLVQRGAIIHDSAEIGELKISGKRRLISMGANSTVGRAYFALHDEVIIGNNVVINDGVELLTASHHVNDPQWTQFHKKITIEDYVWIGSGAMILPGVTLGKGAVIGARAVVSKNVEPYNIVVGNPAKALAKRRSDQLNYNPCEFLAVNMAWLKG